MAVLSFHLEALTGLRAASRLTINAPIDFRLCPVSFSGGSEFVVGDTENYPLIKRSTVVSIPSSAAVRIRIERICPD